MGAALVCQGDFALRQSRRHACGVVVAGDEINFVGRFRFSADAARTRPGNSLIGVPESALEITRASAWLNGSSHVAQQHVGRWERRPNARRDEIHVEAGGHRLGRPSRNERSYRRQERIQKLKTMGMPDGANCPHRPF